MLVPAMLAAADAQCWAKFRPQRSWCGATHAGASAVPAPVAAGTVFVGVPARAGGMPPRAIVAPDLMAAVDLALEM